MNYGNYFTYGKLLPIFIIAGVVILGIVIGFYTSGRRNRQMRK